MTDDALVRQRLEEDPARPGPQHARLRESGVPVWALVGYFETIRNVEQVAADYEVPADDVRAALEYYASNRDAINARLAANVA